MIKYPDKKCHYFIVDIDPMTERLKVLFTLKNGKTTVFLVDEVSNTNTPAFT